MGSSFFMVNILIILLINMLGCYTYSIPPDRIGGTKNFPKIPGPDQVLIFPQIPLKFYVFHSHINSVHVNNELLCELLQFIRNRVRHGSVSKLSD